MKKNKEEQIIFKPKGGNSPIRFFLILNGEKIGMAKRKYDQSWERGFWTVDVYKKKYMKEISTYLHNTQRIERFYWGYLPD